jgi:hypothetical protein
MLEQDPSLIWRQALQNLRTKSDDFHHGHKNRDYELGFASEMQNRRVEIPVGVWERKMCGPAW